MAEFSFDVFPDAQIIILIARTVGALSVAGVGEAFETVHCLRAEIVFVPQRGRSLTGGHSIYDLRYTIYDLGRREAGGD